MGSNIINEDIIFLLANALLEFFTYAAGRVEFFQFTPQFSISDGQSI